MAAGDKVFGLTINDSTISGNSASSDARGIYNHHAHAAAAELLDNAIVRDGLVDHRAMMEGDTSYIITRTVVQSIPR